MLASSGTALRASGGLAGVAIGRAGRAQLGGGGGGVAYHGAVAAALLDSGAVGGAVGLVGSHGGLKFPSFSRVMPGQSVTDTIKETVAGCVGGFVGGAVGGATGGAEGGEALGTIGGKLVGGAKTGGGVGIVVGGAVGGATGAVTGTVAGCIYGGGYGGAVGGEVGGGIGTVAGGIAGTVSAGGRTVEGAVRAFKTLVTEKNPIEKMRKASVDAVNLGRQTGYTVGKSTGRKVEKLIRENF